MDASGGTFQIRPHKDFIPSKGRDRLLSLRLLSNLMDEDEDYTANSTSSSDYEARNAYDFMRRRRGVNGDPTTRRWNALIRLANYAVIEGAPLCVSCAHRYHISPDINSTQIGSVGALLDHITRIRAVGNLEDEGIHGLDIRGIECLTLKEIMHINADALYSLQIFDNEHHASIHSDKTKEGLSLFGILNNTKTSLGKALLHEWLMRPSTSIPIITARHNAVACFMRPENISTANSMHAHLKGIKNVPRILAAMRNGKAQVSDWQGVVKVIHSFYTF